MTHYIRQLLVCSLSATLALASCSKQEVPLSGEQSRASASDTSPHAQAEIWHDLHQIQAHPQRSKQEAISIALDALGSLGGLRSVRATDLDVECVLSPQPSLRSAEQSFTPVDTALYIINLKQGGFALISGDRRTDDLLAVSESGTLHTGQESYGNGLDVFLSRLPAYYETAIRDFEHEFEEIDNSEDIQLLRRPRKRSTKLSTTVEASEWIESSRGAILLNTQWGQYGPYNYQAPLIDGKQAPAGCTSTAIAQLLAYHKYPRKWRGINLRWEAITEFANVSFGDNNSSHIAEIFRALGDRLENKWGLEGTSADDGKIPEILREMGYRYPSERTDFDLNQVISSIAQNKPVVLSGYSETYTYETGWWIFSKTQTGYKGGHAWIADGILNQERTLQTKSKSSGFVLSSRKDTRTLLHCNWGWHGINNGYFLADVLDANNPEATDGRFRPLKGNHYYRHLIRNILYVAP